MTGWRTLKILVSAYVSLFCVNFFVACCFNVISFADTRYFQLVTVLRLKAVSFGSWLNICFLNVYGVQTSELAVVFEPRTWFLSLPVLHNLGAGKYLNSEGCADCWAETSLFFGIWSLKLRLTQEFWPCLFCSVRTKALRCFLQFSLYALCCELENAWEESSKEQVSSVCFLSLGYWPFKSQVPREYPLTLNNGSILHFFFIDVLGREDYLIQSALSWPALEFVSKSF